MSSTLTDEQKSMTRYAKTNLETAEQEAVDGIIGELSHKIDSNDQKYLETMAARNQQNKLRQHLKQTPMGEDLRLSAAFTLARLSPDNKEDVALFTQCLKPSTSELWYKKAYQAGYRARQNNPEKHPFQTELEKQTANVLSNNFKQGYYQHDHIHQILGVMGQTPGVTEGILRTWEVDAMNGYANRVPDSYCELSRSITTKMKQTPVVKYLAPRDPDYFGKVAANLQDIFHTKLTVKGRQADNHPSV